MREFHVGSPSLAREENGRAGRGKHPFFPFERDDVNPRFFIFFPFDVRGRTPVDTLVLLLVGPTDVCREEGRFLGNERLSPFGLRGRWGRDNPGWRGWYQHAPRGQGGLHGQTLQRKRSQQSHHPDDPFPHSARLNEQRRSRKALTQRRQLDSRRRKLQFKYSQWSPRA